MKTKSTDFLLENYYHSLNTKPNNIAVISEDKFITYQDFENTTNKLAASLASLIDLNKKPIYIGVLAEDKLKSLYAIFAILKLGAVFVPLNPSDPVERRRYICDKVEPCLILMDNKELNDPEIPSFSIQKLLQIEASFDFPQTSVNNDLAYVLFTSGSTAANPKGVLQTRYNLHKQIANYTKDLKITENDCLLNLAIFSHDQALVDIFGALLNGATLCLYKLQNGLLNTAEVQETIKKNQVTIFSSVPSVFQLIFEHVEKTFFPRLRIVTIGGEETKLSHAHLFQKTCPPDCLLINGYGATEISWISAYTITEQTDLSELELIPLGFATKACTVKLLPVDGEGNLLELAIGADSLSLGYLKDEEATAEAFFKENDKTYYKTGDVVTMDEGGCLYFHGRLKAHEKINGKRINLNAIERIIQQSAFGKNAIVVAEGDITHRRLYLFHTQKISNHETTWHLERLEDKLPLHMIPRVTFYLKEIPKLPNAKVDRQALIALIERKHRAFKQQQLPKIEALKNSTDERSVLEGFWREALEIPLHMPCGNFKEMGGDSLISIRLVNKINHYYYEKYKFAPFITALSLFIPSQNSFEAFYNYIERAFINTRNLTLKECVTLPRAIERRTYVQEIVPEERQMAFTFNYTGLEILVQCINRQHNLNIHFYPKHSDVFTKFKSIMEDKMAPMQSGFLLYMVDNRNCHLFPAILCKEPGTDTFVLLIADANFTDLEYAMKPNGILGQLKMQFPELQMKFDFEKRGVDTVTCDSLALLYLIEALKTNMLQSLILTTKTLSDYDPLKSRYPLSFHAYQTFISPAATFKASFMGVPEAVDQDALLVSDPKQRSLRQFIAEHSTIFPGYSSLGPDADKSYNTYLWDTTYVFKQIIDQRVANLLPTLFHFKLILTDSEYETSISDLYMKKSQFSSDYKWEDFMQTLNCYLGSTPAGILIGRELISEMDALIKAATQMNPLEIVVLNENEFALLNKSEAEYIKEFREHYNLSLTQSFFMQKYPKPTLLVSTNNPLSLKDIFVDALLYRGRTYELISKLGWIYGDSPRAVTKILRNALSDANLALQQNELGFTNDLP